MITALYCSTKIAQGGTGKVACTRHRAQPLLCMKCMVIVNKLRIPYLCGVLACLGLIWRVQVQRALGRMRKAEEDAELAREEEERQEREAEEASRR